jgi:Leucine-rich repeat (LRR) protein
MERMPNLKKLDLTGNRMERTHSLCDIPSVTELILDGNPIATMKEFMRIGALKQLANLSMLGCPFADEKGDDFRREVLI